MKRLQIMIETEIDSALEREARRLSRSKASLIREYVQERLRPLPPTTADPLWSMVGADEFAPASVDDVVYQ